MKRFFIFCLVLMLVASILLSGCSPQNTPKASGNESVKTEESVPQGGTIRYAVWSSPKGVFLPALSNDSYNFFVIELVYEGLMKFNSKKELEPCLAKSYEISTDNKTITFKLRDDVKWHDGEPFTAEDVQFTFEFMGNADYSGPYGSYIKPIKGAEAYKNNQAQHIEGIKIIDPYTISITTDEIYANALLSFGQSIRIMPKHIWEKVAVKDAAQQTDLLRNPIGTGPFKMSKFVPDQYVELIANDNYWNHKPNVDKFIIQATNQETALAQMLNGEIDLMQISEMNPDDLDLYGSKNIQIQKIHSNTYQYMAINNDLDIFKDKKVRQAFAYAINRETMVKDLLYGYGEVAANPYRSDFWACPENINEYKYDPEKAIELLKEAGWVYNENEKKMYINGQPAKFTLTYPSGSKIREQSAPVIQQDLKKIGIQVDLSIMEFNTALDKIKKGEYELALMGMGGSAGDPDIMRFYGSNYLAPNGLNLARLKNSQVDELLTEGLKHLKVDEQKPIYNEVGKILNEEQPMVYLYFADQGLAISSKLKNIQCSTGFEFYDTEDWYIEK